MITVGVDGSEPSIEALRWAADQAELTGSELETIAVWEWPTSFGWAPPYPSDFNPAADAQRVLDETLGPIRHDHPDVVINEKVIEGRAAPILIEASKQAELLVVGSRGHGEFSGMLLGSVSEHCVTNADCPVVVVRARRRT